MSGWELWTLIPVIFLLTLIYLGLGVSGHWNYTTNDMLFGNGIISLGIGCVYISEGIYKRYKK